MKTAWLLLLVLVVATATAARHLRRTAPSKFTGPVTYPYKQFWFNQTLDHFNWRSQPQTYQQRYLINDDSWDGKGPIFFYTGNEGDIVWFMQNTGFMFDIAPKFNALLIFAEHRYYGESLPFGNSSYDLDNIGFLSSEQALADYANLLTTLKPTFGADLPVIAFGGSYGGMLSGWFRLKYPNVVDGAIAASAPIICGDESIQYTFDEIVTTDFVDAGCGDYVRQAFAAIQTMAVAPQGLQKLTDIFNICPPLQTPSDVTALMGWVENALSNTAMVDYPYPTTFLKNLPAWPVKVMCERMNAQPVDYLAGLAAAMQVWYNDTGLVQCFKMNDTSEGAVGDLAWDYQACTELILPTASNDRTDFFPAAPFSLQQLTTYCQGRWGVTPRENWVSEYYGGRDIGYGSNIVLSSGMLDPWRGLSVTTQPSPSIIPVLIADGAHHLDLRAANPADPQSVIDARELEVANIQKWVQEVSQRRHK